MRIRFVTRTLGVLAAVSMSFLAACVDNDSTGPTTAGTPQPVAAATQVVPGRYIVTMKPGSESGVRTAAAAVEGRKVDRSFSDIGVVTMHDLTPDELSTLRGRPDVASVVADLSVQWIPAPAQLFQLAGAPPAPLGFGAQGTDQSTAAFYPFQWNMQVINAPGGWSGTPGGVGKLACDLDTGIDPQHLDLVGKVDLAHSVSVISAPLFPGDLSIIDYNSHGTFVASIISSRGIGVASTAPDAMICAVKVLNVTGSGSFGDIIAGIEFAIHAGADVINMSLGAYLDVRTPGLEPLLRALQAAINHANREGVVVTASAGNSGIDLDEDAPYLQAVPAQMQGVVSTGATAPFNLQNFDMLASYSNFGGRTGIKLVAPGGDLLPGGNIFDLVLGACSQFQLTLPFPCGSTSYLLGAGTSFAAPHVAGVAALIQSQLGSPPTERVVNCILQSTDVVGPSRTFGAGRLNAGKAAACN